MKKTELTIKSLVRKSGIRLAVTLLTLSFFSCGKSEKWNFVKKTTLAQDMRSHFAGWYDEDLGISVGYAGKSFFYSPETEEWKKAENSSLCRYCLDICDKKTAWSGGNGNHVRVTRDSGKTWQNVNDCKLGSTHRSIDFANCHVGLVATDFKIALTKDGGKTWEVLKNEKFNGKILSVSVLEDGSCYGITKGGDLIFTKNKGSSWTITPVKKLKKASGDGELIACDVNFEDVNTGEMAVSILGSKTKIVHFTTKNGGKTWSSCIVDNTIDGIVTDVLMSKNKNYISIVDANKVMKLYKREWKKGED